MYTRSRIPFWTTSIVTVALLACSTKLEPEDTLVEYERPHAVAPAGHAEERLPMETPI